jgi:hypothetical protein
METGITTGPVSPRRSDILAETTYTHCEEDFVAFWMYDWEHTQNQRLHPLAHRLGTWTRLTTRRALGAALIMLLSAVLLRERFFDCILAGTACVFFGVEVMGLTSWLLRGPRGLFRQLARWRYHRKMRRAVRQMAAQKWYINLGRFHRLLLTADSCIHLTELQEVESGSRMTERTETVTTWAAFERIEVTEHHAFLIERRNSTTILPRSAFRDEAAFQQFMDLARRLHDDAMRGNAPPMDREQRDERIRQ